MGMDNRIINCEGPYPFACYDPIYQPLNYRGEGDIDIAILYTTNKLQTLTEYFEPTSDNWYSNYEKDFDSFYDDEENKLYLQFEIYVGGNTWDENQDNTKCLVCMNVNENSELKDGDTGFAACYK